jgi:hypothetical protein
LVHPAETETLLKAVLDLAGAIDERSAQRRAEARKKLNSARAARLGLASVDDG